MANAPKWFMNDVAVRLANRIQLTQDGHKAYLEAVEGAFGADIDYAMLDQAYGARQRAPRAAIARPMHRAIKKTGLKATRYGARLNLLCRALESHDADAQSPLHPTDKCVPKEIRKPRAHGRDLRGLVQFPPHPQDASRHAGDGAGLSETVMDWSESSKRWTPTQPARKRGPYKLKDG